MHAANSLRSYRQIATLTAPPGQIVLMLFEGAIRSLERSLPGFEMKDLAQANMTVHNNIQRAQEIIRQLNYALNMDEGGECALTLRRLYEYFERRLQESNLQKKPQGVHEVIRHLTELRNAWATMLARQGSAAAVPSSSGALAAN